MSLAAAVDVRPGLGAARCALAAACIAAGGSAMSADVYGLVIGIDAYEHLAPLSGAVNDARDVEAALEKRMGARDVRLLINGDATREAIFRHWDELTRMAGTGDILVFHFAGHGGRQDAVLTGHETKDNLFLLAGFEETGDGTIQRIVDNEMGHMLATEREATVVFVADSCFAGGMVRGVDSHLRPGTRASQVHLARIDDAVSERVRRLGEVDESELENVIWIYGQDDNKVTQEIAIDGQARGALSHMFSRALGGEADTDRDGHLDVRELKRFVSKGVSRLTERRQRPHVNAGSGDLSIRLAGREAAPPRSAVPVLRIHFTDARPAFEITGATDVPEAQRADLLYSSQDRKLVYRTGDVVAEFGFADSDAALRPRLQGAVDKWRLLEMLAGLETSEDPEIELADGNRVYLAGETVGFRLSSAVDRSVLLFNLAYDGTVQLLGSDRDRHAGRGGLRLRPGRSFKFSARVQEPFGADHLVAITAADLDARVFDAVLASDGKRHAALLAQELADALRGVRFGVGRVGLFTRAGEGGG